MKFIFSFGGAEALLGCLVLSYRESSTRSYLFYIPGHNS